MGFEPNLALAFTGLMDEPDVLKNHLHKLMMSYFLKQSDALVSNSDKKYLLQTLANHSKKALRTNLIPF
jgi:hypothetical protein